MIILLLIFTLLQLSCHYSVADNDETITITRQKNRSDNEEHDESSDEWKLRYFPDKSSTSEYDPHSIFADRDDMIDVDPKCDDGLSNLFYDWDESMVENYTCSKEIINPDLTIAPITYSAVIPPAYTAPHFCMNVNITYSDPLITFGGHRKLWARYGEYKFIPKQRWLHNAENGAVIMLYHPCAHPQQIEQLRKIVKSCIFRHIITPCNFLPKERPLALVTWGWQLSMNVVQPKLVYRFIQEHALKAPVNLNLDGKYNYMLKEPAKIVSDEKDTKLCISIM